MAISEKNEQAISLLFGVHAHQPVGNFPEVIAEAHERCYRMFIRTVYDYPDFRFSIHISGWLLDEMEARWPEDMALLSEMTKRGQVEWFGSGDCEPVLASIPSRDRQSQIKTLSDKIETRHGARPRGAWLTERVWESSVLPDLVAAGIEFVAVDDYHFLCAGQQIDNLNGYFSSEENGKVLDLFPISEEARYRIPFAPAEEVVSWLESQAHQQKSSGVIYFDDVEKFCIWPGTYQWVFEQHWLRNFIEGVLASPWIRTEHYQDFRRRTPTRGIVYLPTTSYFEMGEWTLPLDAARNYQRLVTDEKNSGRLTVTKPFCRGGIWRNFFMRYPESNRMHKRMLALSERVNALPDAQKTSELQEYLHRAQANDAYWHGLFGGLYLPHLRRSIWHYLLLLESELEKISAAPALEIGDLDIDGVLEMRHRQFGQVLTLADDGYGAVTEYSSLVLRHNFGDSLRRYGEVYHDKLLAAKGQNHDHHGAGIASAHDRVAFKHEINAEDVVPDSVPRSLFVDSWRAEAEGEAVSLSQYQRQSQAPNTGFACTLPDGTEVLKNYALSADGVRVTYECAPGATGQIEVRLNLAMPSCDGFCGRMVLADGEIIGGLADLQQLKETKYLRLEDQVLGGAVTIESNVALQFCTAPHYTVSQSEAGFEKIMQAVEINLVWPLTPESEEPQSLELSLSLATLPAEK